MEEDSRHGKRDNAENRVSRKEDGGDVIVAASGDQTPLHAASSGPSDPTSRETDRTGAVKDAERDGSGSSSVASLSP